MAKLKKRHKHKGFRFSVFHAVPVIGWEIAMKRPGERSKYLDE